jgi:hypothetical protein
VPSYKGVQWGFMGIVQIIQTKVEIADSHEANQKRRQLIEDPIPDPEPAAPSLGYPDPEIFYPLLDVRTERQPPNEVYVTKPYVCPRVRLAGRA